MTSYIANLIVIALEIKGLHISITDRHFKILAYYTQISNILTMVSSVCYLAMAGTPLAGGLRYISSCMLTMTFLITLCVLVPMGARFETMMLRGNGLYHHTLCPVISVFSYILLEPHNTVLAAPVIITFIYGIAMLAMNYYGKFDGPYPFLRIRNQSKTATVIWIAVLIAVITAISALIGFLAR